MLEIEPCWSENLERFSDSTEEEEEDEEMLSLALLLQHKALQILDSLGWCCSGLFCFLLSFSVSSCALFVIFMFNVK